MFNGLPLNVEVLMKWSWPQFKPYYVDLASRKINAKSIREWLADWSSLDDCVSEKYSRLHVATTRNTKDKQAEADFASFLDVEFPAVTAADQRLKEALLATGLDLPEMHVPIQRMRADADLYREANLPLLSEEQKYGAEYNKIIGSQTVRWEGKETTISQLRPIYQQPDRSRREEAWRLGIRRQLVDRTAINELWKRLLDLRLQIASNAGKKTYRDYVWQAMHRFDYSPSDCLRFHEAIEKTVVPAAVRIYERRKRRLGVAALRPWDLDVDPLGRPPLRPVERLSDLKPAASSIFQQVDRSLGSYFDTMVRESLLDLDNRPDKAPGGYCTGFPMSKRPFIFANAVGLHADLQTLLHESGHAFHNFERYALPFSPQRDVGMEFAEVASMGMELLASPYLSRHAGGVYSEQDAARAQVELLESNILFWPYMAVVDAFQHWVYENPHLASESKNCDEQWAFLWKRFMIGVDWNGLEEEMATGWQRKLHIHRHPFYYIEYGLAQLGAMQIWRNALRDQREAVAAYRRALALGGTVALPELYSAAGARLAFDAKTLGESVALAEQTIGSLEHNA